MAATASGGWNETRGQPLVGAAGGLLADARGSFVAALRTSRSWLSGAPRPARHPGTAVGGAGLVDPAAGGSGSGPALAGGVAAPAPARRAGGRRERHRGLLADAGDAPHLLAGTIVPRPASMASGLVTGSPSRPSPPRSWPWPPSPGSAGWPASPTGWRW